MRKLYAIDFDNTLTIGDCKWWNGDEPIPNRTNIERVNELYIKGNYIIIFSARPWKVAQETIAWLIKYNVRYHGINFNKMSASIYVDDKSENWTK